MNVRIVIAALLLAEVGLLPAAQNLESKYRTAGSAVHEPFETVREVLQTSSALIGRGRRARDEVIYGTVLTSDGYILTKASELGEVGDLTVIVDQEIFESPRVIAEDPAWDVALLKVEARNLIPVHFREGDAVHQGSWVLANGSTSTSRRRPQIGVVSANQRPVYPKGGAVLGVRLKLDEELLVVEEVTEGSGAEKAGVKPDDRLMTFDGQEVETMEDLLEVLKERQVGEEVMIEVERGGETIELEVELAGRVDLFGEEETRNDAMSGEVSKRRSGFPMVLQHDIMGDFKRMGGPVLDLDGQCIGMNIARVSRCETYAIPAKEVREIAERLIPQQANP